MRHLNRRTRMMSATVGGIAALALLVTGCSSAPAPTADAKPTLDVVFKGDQARADAMSAAIDIFLEDHPGWTITTDFQSGSEYMQKLSVRFASKDAPSVMRQERDTLREFSDRGVLIDLSEYIDTTDIPSSILDSGVVDGKLVGAVAGVSSLAYVVDEAAYAEHGVALPDTDTWTWDDYKTSAAALGAASGGTVWGTEFPVGDLVAFSIWLRQHGENLWDDKGKLAFTEKTAEGWFQKWTEFRDAGATPPGGAIDNLGVAAEQSSIGRGLVGSMIIPPNSFAAFNAASGGGLKLAHFPGESSAKQRGQQLIPGMYWAVSTTEEFPKEAGELVNFLLNDIEGNRAMGGTNGTPANPKVADAIAGDLSADDRAAFDYIIKLGEEELTTSTPSPAGTSELVSEMVSLGEEMRADRISPADAAKRIYNAVKAGLGS